MLGQKIILFALRLSLGWIFLYSGVTKIMDPGWSAEGYLKTAQTLPSLFHWFANPQNIVWVNFLNQWGQTLVGLALVSGVFIRIAASSGILLMILYYLPTLNFPYAGRGTSSFIVDQHFIFILVFFLLWAFDAGRYWGLKSMVKKYLKNLPHPIQNLL